MTKAPSRHAIIFVLLCVLLDMIGFGLIIPVLPQLIEQVGQVSLSEASIIGGWMFFAFSMAQFAFSPLMGNLSDRFGRRPLLLLAIAGLGLDNLLQGLAPSLIWLFVGRVIAGVCGSSWVIANAFITDVTEPAARAKYFGMMGGAFGLGFVLGPALGGVLGEFGPRVPFFVAAAISGLNLIYGWFVLPETLAPQNRRAFSLARSNPLGAFKVFRSYQGVIPMCAVMFAFFFFTSVYPAIWPYWGMAKFGWSPSMVGLTLAVFGVVMAAFQGGLTGLGVKWFGERNLALIGLVSALIAASGYGLAGSLTVVVLLMIVHGPEGFIHPMLTAMMTQRVPDDAQGELQGGISAIMNVAMLAGTVLFSQIFGYFMAPGGWQSPDVGFFVAGAGMALTLVMFVLIVPIEEKRL
ncbi:MFS transporter [Cypionkella sp.]|uniref:MFS transporter n=1 Tax=Cypionkella sp. TaxID=2811411 RepID=UPI00271D7B87|nr:MFS transporter [Cypionkella sp.]MDO8982085.1 MFS transporter [Cypionkella sp.]MDP2048684.1 MFS transporter [Cypionkella sp.]